MRFSTVLALSVAAATSSVLAAPAPATPSTYDVVSRRDVADVEELLVRDYDEYAELVTRGKTKKTSKSSEAAQKGQAAAKKLPNELKAEIGKQGLDGSKSAADRAKTLGTSTKDIQKGYIGKLSNEVKSGDVPGASWGLQASLDHNRNLRRSLDAEYDELVDLVARGKTKKTSKSSEAAQKGQAAAKKLPNEVKAEIGKQGLDGSKSAADRAKALGTSTKDIQRGYQSKLNQEVKSGDVPNASWGLQATLDHNRKLRRSLDAEYEEIAELVARGKNTKTSKSSEAAQKGQAAAKKLPNEVKAEIGKQGLDGSRSAADRAKTLGTSTKDIQKGYQPKLNKEIKQGDAPNASWGLQATLDHNRKLRRSLDAEYDELVDLVARGKNTKTSKSSEAAQKGQAAAKKLPNEVKAEIGKQGLDGSKSAADRAKTLGTSTKDIQKGYQGRLNKEVKQGDVPNASWGLQATVDQNRRL